MCQYIQQCNLGISGFFQALNVVVFVSSACSRSSISRYRWSAQLCLGSHLSELHLKPNMQISLSAISLHNTNAFCTVWIIAYRMIAPILLGSVGNGFFFLVFVFFSTSNFRLCCCCMRFCLLLLLAVASLSLAFAAPMMRRGAAWCICALLESLSKLTTCINHYCKTSGKPNYMLGDAFAFNFFSSLLVRVVVLAMCCCFRWFSDASHHREMETYHEENSQRAIKGRGGR